MNVLHAVYTTAGPLNPGIAENIWAAFRTNAQFLAWMALLPPSTICNGVDVRDMRNSNNPLIASTSPSVSGTAAVANTPMAPQVAIVLTLRTAQAGQAFRGRVYAGGLSTAVQDGTGHILGSASAQWRSAIVNFQTVIVTQGATSLGIAQRFLPSRPGHGGVTLPERPAGIVPVNAFVIRDNVFDTQRRRSISGIGSR